ncbi:MAG: 4-(cytidine 5'-diphospho)-2-C-methyl-D-erythritol kinase [Verrucomicrobiales bacterium]
MFEIFRASAPAKVNLSLRVLRRRDDGFHDLETRMCPLSLCDEVALELRESGGVRLTCDDPELPVGEDNLALMAVRAFESAVGREVDAEISITKRIPSGAGLGGGSSDAAAVLRLLNQALETKLTLMELSPIASKIGSDVPFFLFGQSCDASGRGEVIKPIEFSASPALLLVKPPFGIPTPWAYSRWRDSEENPAFAYGAQNLPFGELVNDLERPVFEKYLVLGDLKRWLLAQPEVDGALMSGSGATVFAVLGNPDDTERLAERTRSEFGDTFWTQGAMVNA